MPFRGRVRSSLESSWLLISFWTASRNVLSPLLRVCFVASGLLTELDSNSNEVEEICRPSIRTRFVEGLDSDWLSGQQVYFQQEFGFGLLLCRQEAPLHLEGTTIHNG